MLNRQLLGTHIFCNNIVAAIMMCECKKGEGEAVEDGARCADFP